MDMNKLLSYAASILLLVVLIGCAPAEINGNLSKNAKMNNPSLASPSPEATSMVNAGEATDAEMPPEQQPTESIPPAADQKAGCEAMAEIAKAALSDQIGIPVSSINVLRCFDVNWPDTSLGCPKPDEIYAQVVTPGFQILLEAEGKRYAVHTDTQDQAIVCLFNQDGEGLPNIPIQPGEKIDDGIPWIPVD